MDKLAYLEKKVFTLQSSLNSWPTYLLYFLLQFFSYKDKLTGNISTKNNSNLTLILFIFYIFIFASALISVIKVTFINEPFK